MQELPFCSGDVFLGDKEGVGLCTLWTPKSKYLAQLDKVEVVGNLYSRFGIGILIRNVLATPTIKNIIVTGIDNPEPKRRQANALLKGEFDFQELYLEEHHIQEFYKRTRIHDARDIPLREPEYLTEVIEALHPSDSYTPDPIIVPLPEVTQDVYPTSRSGHIFRASSIKEAHRSLLKEIRLFGEFTQPDSEGHKRQELWQATVCLSQDCSIYEVPHYSADEILRYGEAMWNGDEPEELTYRYGYTIRHKYGDQVQAAIKAFRKKPETFRTVLTLWEPLQSMLRDDEPCLTTIHPRVRNGILDVYAYIRTNEMYRGWPKNAAGLRYFQGRLAQELDVSVGELTISSGSAHLYDLDWPAVDEYLSKPKPTKIQFDSKGDWRLSRSRDKYVAEHYFNGQLLQIFQESSLKRLEKRILPFIQDISHAVYMGRELAKLQFLDYGQRQEGM